MFFTFLLAGLLVILATFSVAALATIYWHYRMLRMKMLSSILPLALGVCEDAPDIKEMQLELYRYQMEKAYRAQYSEESDVDFSN